MALVPEERESLTDDVADGRPADVAEGVGEDVQCAVADREGPARASRAAGFAMAFKLIESAQQRWRAVNAPHLVALVRAGATFENGNSSNDPPNQGVISEPRNTPIHRS